MIRHAIAPIQAWLLSQNRCVGCGMPLSQGKHTKGKGGVETVTCKCKRIYMFDSKTAKYRRALLEEV